LRATGKSEKEATELAQSVDRDRAHFIEKYFHVEWPARHRFHLMVNSGMGEDAAVEVILDAATHCAKHRG
jgi:Cytidylate kinase-like family